MLRGNIVQQITVIVMTARRQNKAPGMEALAVARQGRKRLVSRGEEDEQERSPTRRKGRKEGEVRSLKGVVEGWEWSLGRMEAAGGKGASR